MAKFKSFWKNQKMALSKIIYLTFLSSTPKTITDKIIEIQNDFLWDGIRPGVKHNALISDCANGGLKKSI